MVGISYLINSFAQLLAPALAEKMFPVIVLPAFIGELGTCVWLIVKGVNAAKWDERVGMGPVIESPSGGYGGEWQAELGNESLRKRRSDIPTIKRRRVGHKQPTALMNDGSGRFPEPVH